MHEKRDDANTAHHKRQPEDLPDRVLSLSPFGLHVTRLTLTHVDRKKGEKRDRNRMDNRQQVSGNKSQISGREGRENYCSIGRFRH